MTPPLTWTTEKPTEAGVYWVAAKGAVCMVVVYGEVPFLSCEKVKIGPHEMNFGWRDITHWYRIPEPEGVPK